MSNNKQSTSIEWLLHEALQWNVNRTDNSQYIQFPSGAIEQAKAMHKKETIDFALLCMMPNMEPDKATIEVVSDIYDEVFGGDQ